MRNTIKNGATDSEFNDKMIDGRVHIFFRNNPERLEQDLIRFAESNQERVENQTFLIRLNGLKRLKWVCVNNEEQSNRLFDLTLKAFDRNEHRSNHLDIHFEMQNQRGNYLLIGRYSEDNVYYLGRYIKTNRIEDGVWYYSYYPIPYKFKRVLYLKKFVETFDKYCPKFNGNQSFIRSISYPTLSRYA